MPHSRGCSIIITITNGKLSESFFLSRFFGLIVVSRSDIRTIRFLRYASVVKKTNQVFLFDYLFYYLLYFLLYQFSGE